MNDMILADVSEWQGEVNWHAYVTGGNPGAIVRAYSGSRPDEYWGPVASSGYPGNRAGFWAAGGTVLGIYSYLLDPTAHSVTAQANAFCDLVGPLRAGEYPILDMEAGPSSDLSGYASTWRTIVQDRLVVEPWLYTSLNFFQTRNLKAAGFPADRITIAAYGQSEPTSPAHAMWQFTDAYGPMPGIASAHDANRFHGTGAQLLASLGIGGTTPPPVDEVIPFPGTGAFVLGRSNPNVTLLGQWLIDRGYGRFYQVGPGPVLGPHDIEACRQFQLDQGWTGDNANGYPGPVTWARLQDPGTKPVAHPPVPFPGTGAFVLGKSSPMVTLLGQWLINKGYGGAYTNGPGPVMSQTDVNACAAFQRAQGWTGTDANGYPGPVTWARLQS